MGVCSITGEFAHYPLVISEQQGGICKLVTGPATSLGVPKKLEDQAKECVRKIGLDASLVGAYGVEMFETREGEILINEIAPRVHNSGHYTQNACAVSQFENHWRALLGIPLHQPSHTPFFGMLNLLGPPGVNVKAAKTHLPVPGPHSELHWYGKEEIRPGRKLGHFNGIAHSPESLSALLKELKMCEEEWVKGLLGK
jgi:phosphoribosylaminoimidazole carboxylase (NCAIR synthetase)